MESPPADVLAWVEGILGEHVAVAGPMVGGIDAHLFRLRVGSGDDVVLRIAKGGDWDDIAHQARMLDLLATTDVPAPLVLGMESAVGSERHPVLIQTLLRGDPTLPEQPSDEWLRSLVETHCAIRGLPMAPWMPDRLTEHWAKLADFDDDRATGLDGRLLGVLWKRQPGSVRVVGHNDYWIGNTLREADRVVGVVDWGGSGLVSPARDVTYCAVDMSLCYGLPYGDDLVALFREQVDVADSEVDLWTARAVIASRWFPEWLKGWNGLGAPVTHEQAAGRRTELLERTLTRLG